jgi:anti-anti-sigma regulatory factor
MAGRLGAATCTSRITESTMPIALDESELGNVVVLEGTIDVSSATELKAMLLRALGTGKEVCISLDAATYLDVTAVQLLWAAEQQARLSGAVFRFSGNLSEPVTATLADAGFPSFQASVNAG